VYESLWGNTAAVAAAIAEGLGEDAVALSTAAADATALEGVELIVAGAPLLGFNLPTEEMRANIAKNAAGPKADFSSPSMRSWIAGLAPGGARFAAFETRIWWSPGSAPKHIAALLEEKGYHSVSAPERFIVTAKYGPLKAGELERARAWGASLARIGGAI
jgi:flavodoxin